MRKKTTIMLIPKKLITSQTRIKEMKRILLSFFMFMLVFSIYGQDPDGDYNPFVGSPSINPSPLSPVEVNGTGTLSFEIGNTGSDDLDVFTDQFIILTITLSYGVPDNDNPVEAISGAFSNRFSWSYNSGENTFTGTQTESISGSSVSTISIAYRVTRNSASDDERNGFNINLTPAAYQADSNSADDDAADQYTWTEIRDYGDAPASYGSAYHVIDFSMHMGEEIDGEDEYQASENADGDDSNGEDDEDGVTFSELVRGNSATISVNVVGSGHIHAWIDWNIDGDFNDTGERIIFNAAQGDETDDFSITVPANALISEPTFARFRFGPRGLESSGPANSGEVEDYQIRVICDVPPAPSIGTITQPTCTLSTGSVILNGMPSGTWTLIRNPGGITSTGSGTSTTVSGLSAGTYNFAFTNSEGCTSLFSANVVINPQPSLPAAPVVGEITHPDCESETGSVALSGLPSGNWTINPGPVSGSGTSTVISGLIPGTYNFTVTNAAGCTSPATANVIINEQPPTPSNPVATVDCSRGFGNAVITITSPVGTGLEYQLNGGAFQTSASFAGVANGDYTILVRNAAGCTATGDVFTVSCTCLNVPTITLSDSDGSTCGTTNPVTISGNTFGGSTTSVTITHNGDGTVSPSTVSASPFSFTYTPVAGDSGETIIINLTSNEVPGCDPASVTYVLTINNFPSAPVAGTITHPTCLVATGSVILNGLPSTGTWTLTRNPGAVTSTGTGTSTTITSLNPGTYTFGVANSTGCASAAQTTVVINPLPALLPAPVVGNIVHPTCTVSTGSVVLSGLPAAGTWSLLRNPGGEVITGTGSTRTVTGLTGGTYTFIVTDAAGCTSAASANVVIQEQPATPAAPVSGTITQPTCNVSTGSVVLNELPATGTWTLTRYPGTIVTTGTGTSSTVSALNPGTYNFTVTSSQGCVSALSANVIIAPQPETPAAPVVGVITQPTCIVTSGSVTLSGLPPTGTWTLTRSPGNVNQTGTGTSVLVPGLLVGTYTFTVTNSAGCQSATSTSVAIVQNPSLPIVMISQPDPVCAPAAIDLTTAAITAGSTGGLTFSYWTDPQATIPYSTPEKAQQGTYYIKGTTSSLCSDVKEVNVTILNAPSANAGASQALDYRFETTLDANDPAPGETGKWSIFTGSGNFTDINDPRTSVNNLAIGKNIFLWVVDNDACPPAFDTVTITVLDLTVPTLITPNNDGNNDFLIIRGIELQEKTELTIFNRRGTMVFENKNYDNQWNGVDYNGNPLPDDTYFFVIRTDRNSRTGYIVIRR
jgi:gliding motility-associated-like protein